MCSRQNPSIRSLPQCPKPSCPLNNGIPRQVPLAESWCPAGYRLACPACYTEVVPCEACDALVPVLPNNEKTYCPSCGFRCFIDTLERAVCGLSPNYPLSSDDVIAVQTSKQTDVNKYLNAKLRQLDDLEKQLREMPGAGDRPPKNSTTTPRMQQQKGKERTDASKKSRKGGKKQNPQLPCIEQPGAAPTPGANVSASIDEETDPGARLHRKRKRPNGDAPNKEVANRLGDAVNEPIDERSQSNSSEANKRRRLNELENRADPTDGGMETSNQDQNAPAPENEVQTVAITAKSRGGGGKRKKARMKARKALERSSSTRPGENDATDPSLARLSCDILPEQPLAPGTGTGAAAVCQISESQPTEACTLRVSSKKNGRKNDPNVLRKRNMLTAEICECRRQIALLYDGDELSLRIGLWSRIEKGISDCVGDVVSYRSSFDDTKLSLLRTLYSLEDNTDDAMNVDNEDINTILSLIPKFQSMLPPLMATKMATNRPGNQKSFPPKLLSERSESATSSSRPCPPVRSKSLPSNDSIRAAVEPTFESEREYGMEGANIPSDRPVSILWRRLLELVGREMDRVSAMLLEESREPVDGRDHTDGQVESDKRRTGAKAIDGDNVDREDPDEVHNDTQKSTSTPGSFRCLGLQRFKERHSGEPTTAASLLQSMRNGNVRSRQLEKIRLFRCLYRSVAIVL